MREEQLIEFVFLQEEKAIYCRNLPFINDIMGHVDKEPYIPTESSKKQWEIQRVGKDIEVEAGLLTKFVWPPTKPSNQTSDIAGIFRDNDINFSYVYQTWVSR